jgi:FG-GAP repeat
MTLMPSIPALPTWFAVLALLQAGRSFAAAPPCPPAPFQGVQIAANDAGFNDHYGRALDVSGNTAVTSSRYDDHSGLAFAGSAYVLVQSGSGWSEQAKLIAGDPEFQDLFGHSVAISGDTVIVGSRNDDHPGLVDAGSAYIFVRSGTIWTQQAKLIASDAAEFDHFGLSVELLGDTAIIGAGFDDHAGGIDAGSVYVFVRSGASWTQQAKLTAGDAAAQDAFGYKTSLHGNTLIVGAPFDDTPSGIDCGSAYCFVRTGTTWSETAHLIAADAGPDDRFGDSVVLSGARAVVGSPLDDHSGKLDAGSAYVYAYDGTSWVQQAKLVPSDNAAGDFFGHIAALAGHTLLIGAPQADVAGVDAAGAAYVFDWTGSAWVEQAKLSTDAASLKDNFGSAAGLSGSTALIGVPHDDIAGAEDAGSVYSFALATDCNGNDVPDALDLALGTSADCNQNGIPDECDLDSGAALDLDGEGTPDTCQALSASGPALSVSVGGALTFSLHAGTSHAGKPYFLLGSLSGTQPGIPVDGQFLALNPDAYFFLTLAGGSPLQGGSGLLDGAGSAGASLVLPPGSVPPSLAGTVAFHAYALLDLAPLAVSFTSNPIPTTLEL